jgi:hypothetical protein
VIFTSLSTVFGDTNTLVIEDTLIRIGYENKAGLNLGPATQYDSVCGMMKSLMVMIGV